MIATLLKTVGISDSSRRLAQALAEIRGMAARRTELEAQSTNRRDVSSYFVSKMQQAAAEYERTLAPEDLERLILCEMTAEKAQQRAAVERKIEQYGAGADSKFRSEFPHWREKLKELCELKLQAARGELARITAQEAERLGQSYSADEVEHSPPVRRANSVVQSLEFRLRQIASDPPETCWANNVASLVE